MADRPNALWPELPGTTGDLVPLRRDPGGALHLAWPGALHDVVNSTFNALTGPGEVLTGRNPATNRPASPDLFQIASDTAGFLAGSGAPLPRVPGSLAMFGGIKAKTANMQKLAEALTHEGRGKSPQHIWEQTGWFRGPDNKWRFEIPDDKAYIKAAYRQDQDLLSRHMTIDPTQKLPDIMGHPALFKAYPEMGNIEVRPMNGVTGAAAFYPASNIIKLAPDLEKQTHSTLLHEGQHWIQEHEGFAEGGSPEQFLTPEHHNNRTVNDLAYDTIKPKIEALGADPDKVLNGLRRFSTGQPLGDTAEHLKLVINKDPELADQFRGIYNTHARLQAERNAAQDAYRSLAGEAEAFNVQERFEAGDHTSFPPSMPGYPPYEKQKVIVNGQEQPMMAVPVDHDPFNAPRLLPVEHDPWQHEVSSIDHDPFATEKKD